MIILANILSALQFTDIEYFEDKYYGKKIKSISYYKKSKNKIELTKEEFYYKNGQLEKEINYTNNQMDGIKKERKPKITNN